MLRVFAAPTRAATDILSLADAKSQLRVDASDEDAYITTLIALALDTIEKRLRRLYRLQTLEWVVDRFPGRPHPYLPADRPWHHHHHDLRLPVAPVSGIVSIVTLAFPYGPGTVTLDPSTYVALPAGPSQALRAVSGSPWPQVGQGPEPIVIRFVAGSDNPPPPGVIHAMKLLVSHWYERREPLNAMAQSGTTELPYGIDTLLSDERWW